MVHGHFGLAHGGMGQEREARQVAADIDTGQGGLHVFVHHDAAAFGLLQVEVLQPETLRHGAATHAHQQPFGHDGACAFGILIPHLYLPAFGHGQRNDLRAEHELHAALGIVGPQEGGEFLVHAAQYLVHHLDDRHLHAQAVEERGELHADDSAADDGQRLG